MDVAITFILVILFVTGVLCYYLNKHKNLPPINPPRKGKGQLNYTRTVAHFTLFMK